MNSISLTYKGVIVAALGGIIAAAGVDVVPSQEEISTFVNVALVLGGAITALVGRWRAGGITMFGSKKQDGRDGPT